MKNGGEFEERESKEKLKTLVYVLAVEEWSGEGSVWLTKTDENLNF